MKSRIDMKNTLKLLVILFSIAIITPGITSCDIKEQKEARLKAKAVRETERQERKKLYEQLKTESGLRQYLTGKTYVYADNPKIHWLKITFVDQNYAIVHLAKASERSWGECIRESRQYENTRSLSENTRSTRLPYKFNVEEYFDDYGRKTGESIHLNVWGDYSVGDWMGRIDCVYSDSDYSVGLNTMLEYYDDRFMSFVPQMKTVALREVDANYFPPEWKD